MALDILYSSDNNYAMYAGISLISLFENNKTVKDINVYYIDNYISRENKEKLVDISKKYNRNILFISGEKITEKFKTNDDFPLAAYARLLISNEINVDKIIYIDCDTIVKGSLLKLSEIDMSTFLVAGVQDNPAPYMLEIIGMNRNDRYINSGVMLLNLKRWREENLENKFLEFIRKYNGSVPHHDQGIINGVCKGSIYILPPKYNSMSQFYLHDVKEIRLLYKIENYYSQIEINEAINSPVIIHYISKFYDRPWTTECSHPLKHEYLHYHSLSPWNELPLTTSSLDSKIKFRKFIFNSTPILIYKALEEILDIKRKFHYKKIYNNMKSS